MALTSKLRGHNSHVITLVHKFSDFSVFGYFFKTCKMHG